MAISAYLVVDGLPGPSTSKQDAIDILSFSFGASQTTSSSGSALRAGKADVSNVPVMKVLDKTSPELFQHCVTGDFLTKVDIIYDKAMGDNKRNNLSSRWSKLSSHPSSFRVERKPHGVDFIRVQEIQVCYNPEQDGKLQGFVQKGFDAEKLKGF